MNGHIPRGGVQATASSRWWSIPVPSAFARDLVALLPRLRRFARALSGSADRADDLVQAACERALRAEARFEPGTRLDAWMFRIIRNLWIDGLRAGRQGGARSVPLEEAAEVADIPAAAKAEAALTLAAVREAIALLPEQQREVIVLVCIEGLSYREAADVLEVPIGTVMSRLARARLALAAAVGPDAGGGGG